MFVSVSPSEVHVASHASVPSFVRASSTLRASFVRQADRTAVAGLYEAGGVRLRFPHAGSECEGVLINTAGGMTGGDTARLSFDLQHKAAATVSTQSAEKVYRAEAAPASVDHKLSLAEEAALAWLPQETILFDGARLVRSLQVTMAASARLTLLEIVVFGRVARGERMISGFFRDRWRVRREGQLVLAEEVRLDGPISELLARRSIGGGARAVAILAHVSPTAEARLSAVRRSLAGARSECGVSAWNGLLVARFASADPAAVRADAARAVIRLLRATLPRVWSC
jgi:urease accessory protein